MMTATTEIEGVESEAIRNLELSVRRRSGRILESDFANSRSGIGAGVDDEFRQGQFPGSGK
jgi:hypothetical protein